jgi:hypothetical protein
MSRTAIAAGIRRLYHYEKFNSAYLVDVLVGQRVHCADPAALNDPWDCRPWFDDEALDNPNAVDELINWFFSFQPTSPVSEEQVRATQEEIRTNPEYRRQILDRFSKDFLKVIPDRWKLYCLTPVPDSTLMWSHYAENHTGICLEFALDNAVFGSAQEVTYLASYPKWTPHSLMTGDGPHVLLTKSDDWQYEREYRVIGLGEGIARPYKGHPLMLSGNFLGLPAGALQAVIVGCEAGYETIKALVSAVAPSLKVKRAVRARTRYRLEIVEG